MCGFKGILGFVSIIAVLAIGIGSNLSSMINGPAAIIAIGGTLGLLLSSGANVINMFRAIFAGDATVEELESAAKDWGLAGALGLGIGGVGMLIGLVIMLKNMDDPAAIGPAMAIATLCLFYGFLIMFFVAVPLQARLEDRVQEFVFSDIAKLKDRELQMLIREVDQKDLVIALKGTQDELKERILGNMSESVRTHVQEEIEFLGPMRLRDVEEVQLRIVQQVRQLEKQGQVSIARGDLDDTIV